MHPKETRRNVPSGQDGQHQDQAGREPQTERGNQR